MSEVRPEVRPEVRQRSIALILARELAVNVTTPMWIWDEEGMIVYFNEPARAIIGRPFDDMSSLRLEELHQFHATDDAGNPVDVPDLPTAVAIRDRKPANRILRITALDGVSRRLSVTAFPLFVRDQFVGAMAVFWSMDEDAN